MNNARLMFEVGTLDESELGARSGGFGEDDFNTELGVDELLAIQNTMFEARTVCKANVTTHRFILAVFVYIVHQHMVSSLRPLHIKIYVPS